MTCICDNRMYKMEKKNETKLKKNFYSSTKHSVIADQNTPNTYLL